MFDSLCLRHLPVLPCAPMERPNTVKKHLKLNKSTVFALSCCSMKTTTKLLNINAATLLDQATSLGKPVTAFADPSTTVYRKTEFVNQESTQKNRFWKIKGPYFDLKRIIKSSLSPCETLVWNAAIGIPQCISPWVASYCQVASIALEN